MITILQKAHLPCPHGSARFWWHAVSIAHVAFSDIRKLFNEEGNLHPLHELDENVAAAITHADVVTLEDGDEVVRVKKIKLWDKNAALEKLMKHLTRTYQAPPESVAILEQFQRGEASLIETALEFAMLGLPLPEPIKILLSRSTPPEEKPAEEFGFSEEELEARYQESLREEERQLNDFRPERREEIRELKEKLKGQGGFDVEAMIREAEEQTGGV